MPMLTKFMIAASAAALVLPGSYVPSELDTAPVAAAGVALPPEAWAPQDQADATYRRAREALRRNRFDEAAALFREIPQKWPRSTYVAESLYWQAYALQRAGGESKLREALRALDEHERRFANARTAADARALHTRISGQLAQMGDPAATERVRERAQAARTGCDRDDDDMRSAALQSLMQMDEGRALPILRDVLKRRDACSESLRRRAVFILSQQEGNDAQALMLDVVRTDPSREVREQAVHWLGQMEGPQVLAALQDIALRGTDESMRDKAVFALSQQDSPQARAVLRQLAESDATTAAIRDKAIFWIGQGESAENAQFLRQLFGRLGRGGNEELKKKILFSLSQMEGQGNDRWLMSVVGDASQPMEVRKHALFSAGQADVAASELVALYGRVTEPDLKEHLIWVLSEAEERVATDKLIDIARRDPEVRYRKRALFWLGQKDDPRIQQLLLEILNKP
jgi:hypothetical protein